MSEPLDHGHSPNPDQRLVRALEHPARAGFLKLLAERPALDLGEAQSLLDRPDLARANIAYHVRVLNLFGLVEPVKDPSAGGAPRFAATPAGEEAVNALGLPPQDEGN